MTRFLFWIAAVVIPTTALLANPDITHGNWEFLSTRVGVYLFLLAFLGYLAWKNNDLESRLSQIEQQLKKSTKK